MPLIETAAVAAFWGAASLLTGGELWKRANRRSVEHLVPSLWPKIADQPGTTEMAMSGQLLVPDLYAPLGLSPSAPASAAGRAFYDQIRLRRQHGVIQPHEMDEMERAMYVLGDAGRRRTYNSLVSIAQTAAARRSSNRRR